MFFFEHISMEAWLFWLALLVGLMVGNEVSRRSKIGGITFFIVIPIILTLFVWPNTAVEGSGAGNWFQHVKAYSALAGCIGFMAIRYIPKLQHNKIALCFPPLILAINITEAVIRDFQAFTFNGINDGMLIVGGPWNIINGIAGILSILTITGWFGIVISKKKSQDMVWPDMLWFWIIAYDLWNIAYVYNTSGDRAFYSIALLLAPTILAFVVNKGAWLQNRASTLALHALLLMSAPGIFLDSAFTVLSTHDPVANMTISCIALASNVAVAVYEVYTIKKTHRNPLKDDLYVENRFYQSALRDAGYLPKEETSKSRAGALEDFEPASVS